MMAATKLIFVAYIALYLSQSDVSAFPINKKISPWALSEELDHDDSKYRADDKLISSAFRTGSDPPCACNKLTIRYQLSNVLVYNGIIKENTPFPISFEARVVDNKKLVFKVKLEGDQRFTHIATRYFFERLKIFDESQLGDVHTFSFDDNVRKLKSTVILSGDEVCAPDPLKTTFGIWAKIFDPIIEHGNVIERCGNEVVGRETFRLQCID